MSLNNEGRKKRFPLHTSGHARRGEPDAPSPLQPKHSSAPQQASPSRRIPSFPPGLFFPSPVYPFTSPSALPLHQPRRTSIPMCRMSASTYQRWKGCAGVIPGIWNTRPLPQLDMHSQNQTRLFNPSHPAKMVPRQQQGRERKRMPICIHRGEFQPCRHSARVAEASRVMVVTCAALATRWSGHGTPLLPATHLSVGQAD
ncbi:hypothetical protein E2C01_090119 [Portunus trituberculatus]|uniref:Uncharacterized protein n=1 Tax=Portunus trituberculatus TaxID=210409 RepID=A0A5B7JPB1_PORTR|nr:hypothetical protein [Portunus trituberculatus]